MRDRIDFVILWVDGNDSEWRRRRASFSLEETDNGSTENRFRDWGLLRYWFRGAERFAPWADRIFFVTDGQVPSWLNLKHPGLRVVRHEEYIPSRYLPTFNSNVIELWLYRIPDLSEHFVLFNDDMYLTAPVDPEDFFQKGLPMESALLDMITATAPEDCFPHTELNNFALINSHFDKKDVIRKHRGKFFSMRYRGNLIRNFLLSPFKYFSCFRDSHLPSSHLKSTFSEVWEAEPDILDQCSENRFRSRSDVSHWLMKDWRICKGEFCPRSTGWGRHYELGKDEITEICRNIERQRYRTVCLNDSRSDVDFEGIRACLAESFERLLPGKSEYEREAD